jgi:hypothetical protein
MRAWQRFAQVRIAPKRFASDRKPVTIVTGGAPSQAPTGLPRPQRLHPCLPAKGCEDRPRWFSRRQPGRRVARACGRLAAGRSHDVAAGAPASSHKAAASSVCSTRSLGNRPTAERNSSTASAIGPLEQAAEWPGVIPPGCVVAVVFAGHRQGHDVQ